MMTINRTNNTRYAVIFKTACDTFLTLYSDTLLPACKMVQFCKDNGSCFKFVRIPSGEIINQS